MSQEVKCTLCGSPDDFGANNKKAGLSEVPVCELCAHNIHDSWCDGLWDGIFV